MYHFTIRRSFEWVLILSQKQFGQATPLLLTVAVIELSDVAFAVYTPIHHHFVNLFFAYKNNEAKHWYFVAHSLNQVDSIPAVFGVTRDPFIVLTSNLFAIIGSNFLVNYWCWCCQYYWKFELNFWLQDWGLSIPWFLKEWGSWNTCRYLPFITSFIFHSAYLSSMYKKEFLNFGHQQYWIIWDKCDLYLISSLPLNTAINSSCSWLHRMQDDPRFLWYIHNNTYYSSTVSAWTKTTSKTKLG